MFKCRNGPCLDQNLVCDEYINCRDYWTDEENCIWTNCLENLKNCSCEDRNLKCTGMGLENIPDLDGLTDFQENFYFSRNQLTSRLEFENQSKIYNASLLDLSYNRICDLRPRTFFKLQSLKILILQHNCISILFSKTFEGLSELNGL